MTREDRCVDCGAGDGMTIFRHRKNPLKWADLEVAAVNWDYTQRSTKICIRPRPRGNQEVPLCQKCGVGR